MKTLWIKPLILLLVIALPGAALGGATWKIVSSESFAPSEEEIDRRISFIEDKLEASKRHSEIWFWSWMAVNGGSTVGLGLAAGLSNKGSDRVNYASQGVLAALGVGDLLFRPLQARYGAEPIRRMPAATREEKLAKLQAAEALLRSNAERAGERKAWIMHLANLLLNAAAGAATGLAGDASDGAVNAGAGFLLGEIYILTQPASPKKDWEEYEAGISSRGHGDLHISIDSFPMGLALRVSW